MNSEDLAKGALILHLLNLAGLEPQLYECELEVDELVPGPLEPFHCFRLSALVPNAVDEGGGVLTRWHMHQAAQRHV